MTFTPDALKGFPQVTLRAGSELHRMHRADRDPLHFDRSELGRFNPVHAAQDIGACYLADDPLGAFVEVFRSIRAIEETAVTARRLTTVELQSDLVLADLTDRRALTFDVSSLPADRDYAHAQMFSSAIADAGFAGIRYFARHDPAQQLVAYALFGPAGSSSIPGSLNAAPARLIDVDLQRHAATSFGYRILPRP